MKKRFISVKTDKTDDLPLSIKDGQHEIKDRYHKIEVPEELFDYVEGLQRQLGELRLMKSLREDEQRDLKKRPKCGTAKLCREIGNIIMEGCDAWCVVGSLSSRMHGKTYNMSHEEMVSAAAFIMEKVTGKSLLP